MIFPPHYARGPREFVFFFSFFSARMSFYSGWLVFLLAAHILAASDEDPSLCLPLLPQFKIWYLIFFFKNNKSVMSLRDGTRGWFSNIDAWKVSWDGERLSVLTEWAASWARQRTLIYVTAEKSNLLSRRTGEGARTLVRVWINPCFAVILTLSGFS